MENSDNMYQKILQKIHAIQKISEKKRIFCTVLYWPIHRDESALSICEPVHKQSHPEKNFQFRLKGAMYFVKIHYLPNNRLLLLMLGQSKSFFRQNFKLLKKIRLEFTEKLSFYVITEICPNEIFWRS